MGSLDFVLALKRRYIYLKLYNGFSTVSHFLLQRGEYRPDVTSFHNQWKGVLFHFFIFSGFHEALDQASSYKSSSCNGLRDKWQLVLAFSARRDFTEYWNYMLDSGMADNLEMGIFFICLLWPEIPSPFFVWMTLNLSTFLSY